MEDVVLLYASPSGVSIVLRGNNTLVAMSPCCNDEIRHRSTWVCKKCGTKLPRQPLNTSYGTACYCVVYDTDGTFYPDYNLREWVAIWTHYPLGKIDVSVQDYMGR